MSDSDATRTDSLSSSMRLPTPDALPTIGEPNPIHRLESEIQDETGIFSTSLSKKVRVPTRDDDLFGSIKVKPKLKSDSDDDLFAAPVTSKPKATKPSDSLFSTSPPSVSNPTQSLSQPTATSSVFDSPPEDIFAPSTGSRQAAVGADDIFATSKATSGVADGSKKLDDLLGSPKKTTVKKEAVEETDGRKVSVRAKCVG